MGEMWLSSGFRTGVSLSVVSEDILVGLWRLEVV